MPDKRNRRFFIADRKRPPVMAEDVLPDLMQGPNLLEELGLERENVPHYKAKALVGKTFTIVAASQFKSNLGNRSEVDPFYCVCQAPLGGIFTTVLGGQVTGQALEAWIAEQNPSPLIVTLDWLEGGDFGGYYVFKMKEREDVIAGTPDDVQLPSDQDVPF